MVTRLSTAAISRSNGNVPSIDPSSTSTISKVSPLASITDLSRAYKSVTFSCSLWSGTTIEYLSTVSFYYTGTRRRFAVTSVRRESDGLEARLRSCALFLQEPALSGVEGAGFAGARFLCVFFAQDWDSPTPHSPAPLHPFHS